MAEEEKTHLGGDRQPREARRLRVNVWMGGVSPWSRLAASSCLGIAKGFEVSGCSEAGAKTGSAFGKKAGETPRSRRRSKDREAPAGKSFSQSLFLLQLRGRKQE